MNRSLRNALVALVVLVSFALAVRTSPAATVTWTGSGDSTWTDPDGNSFSGTFDSSDGQDDVVFNDSGAGTDPITLSGTVSPALKTFSNTGAKTYRLNGGTLGGTGNLAVSGGGLLNLGTKDTTTPNRPALSFTGNTTISSGSKVALYYSGATQTLGLGSGTITLDNGKLGCANMSDQPDGNVDTLSSPITVNAGGGTLSTAGSVTDYYSCVETRVFGGALTLSGNLSLDNVNRVDATAAHIKNYSSKLTFSGGVTANGSVQINNANLGTTYWDGTRGSTLTFTGPFSGSGLLTFTGADAATRAGTTIKIQAGADATDLLNSMRGSGGSVKMASGMPLQLSRGYFKASDFAGSGSNALNLYCRSIGNYTLDTANGGDNTLHIGTGASQFSTLWFNDDQPNSIRNGAGVGNIQIENGGTMKFSVGSGNWYQNVSGGNFRFLNGSTIQGDYRSNGQSINPQGTATFALGDGNNGTADTVTFSSGSYFILIDKAGYSWSQDNGVTIRYANTATNSGLGWADYTSGGNTQQANLKVKNGAAGTEFAPGAGTTMYLAGPVSGNVIEISSAGTLTTTGTVEFRNNTAVGTYTTGPIAIKSGGALNLQAAGKVKATTVTADAGGTLSGIGTVDAPTIGISGTVNPGNSPGILTLGVSGNPTTVTFGSGGKLTIEMQGSATPGVDYDVLNVVGSVVFQAGSQLNLSYLNGYSPTPVTAWPNILTATGTITGWQNLALPARYRLALNGGNLTLNLVPEPASLAVFGLAGLGLLRRRVRRA